MPRSRRGGPRTGTQGTQYTNRSDLASQPRQPVRTATGQAYGEAGAQAAAQRAVPLPQQPQMPRPALPAFDAPTQRPTEPLTAGLPIGPGPGPDALGLPAPENERGLDLEALRTYLPALELMASMPSATVAGRNYVRRLRGAIPR